MKIINIDGENLEELNKLRNFNEIFRKDVTYDDIKSNKNQVLTLSLEDMFLKNHRRGQVDPSKSFKD